MGAVFAVGAKTDKKTTFAGAVYGFFRYICIWNKRKYNQFRILYG